jgi:hypothetical protein
MNQAEVHAKCDALREMVGDTPHASRDLGNKASVIANLLLGAAPPAPPALGLRAKSLRTQLALWFASPSKLKTAQEIKLSRSIIRDDMGVLERRWDGRRPRPPSH